MDTAHSSSDKATQILQAATRLLVEKGVPSLSFEGVAAEAGLSRQLVRYYYASTDALMVDLCDHLGQAYQDALVKGIVKVGQVERLNFFLDFFFGVSEASPMPDNLEAYDGMFAYAVGCTALRDRLCAHYQMLGQVMMHELAIAHPTLTPDACQELSFLFVSAMHAHWSFVATLGYAPAHNHLARQAFERLITSYEEHGDLPKVIDKPWTREA